MTDHLYSTRHGLFLPNKHLMFRLLTRVALIAIYLAVGIGILMQKPVREYISRYMERESSDPSSVQGKPSASLMTRGVEAIFDGKPLTSPRKSPASAKQNSYSEIEVRPAVKTNPFAQE